MRLLCILLLFTVSCYDSYSQDHDGEKGQNVDMEIMEPDSVIMNRYWRDNNGDNNLSIKVYAACNPEKPPYDAHKTKISAKLKNIYHDLKIEYDEPEYQMCMIFFSEKNIWFHDLNGIRAIFIPFSYCANMDSTIRLSYIIFYNKQKYLFHFIFECDEDPDGNGKCTLDSKSAEKQVKKLPKELRNVFFNYLKESYNTEKQILGH